MDLRRVAVRRGQGQLELFGGTLRIISAIFLIHGRLLCSIDMAPYQLSRPMSPRRPL
jgi:hypothetical protein